VGVAGLGELDDDADVGVAGVERSVPDAFLPLGHGGRRVGDGPTDEFEGCGDLGDGTRAARGGDCDCLAPEIALADAFEIEEEAKVAVDRGAGRSTRLPSDLDHHLTAEICKTEAVAALSGAPKRGFEKFTHGLGCRIFQKQPDVSAANVPFATVPARSDDGKSESAPTDLRANRRW